MIKLLVFTTKTNYPSINLEKNLLTVYFFILKARQHTGSSYKMYDKNDKKYKSSAFINISNKKKQSEENSENNTSTSNNITYKIVITKNLRNNTMILFVLYTWCSLFILLVFSKGKEVSNV